jgi:translation elongation factor EF-1alpha
MRVLLCYGVMITSCDVRKDVVTTDGMTVQARVLIVNCVRPIIAGQAMVLHMHSTSSPCRVSKLLSLLDTKTGKETKSGSKVRVLLQDQAADVELQIENPTCVEVLPCSTSLGRFVLRMNGRMTALGSIKSIPPPQPVC